MGTPNEVMRVLNYGGVVILPTETVYGLATRADDSEAVERLYAIKGREFDKPLALCVSSADVAQKFAKFDDTAKALADKFWPGPLTLVLPLSDTPAVKTLSPQMMAKTSKGEPTIALRCPDVEWRDDITDTPIALTSANKSGEPAPTTAKDAAKTLGYDVDDMWLGADCAKGLASTIITLAEGTPKILRQGALPENELSEWLGS